MCGIAGWFDTAQSRSPHKGLVTAMATAIAHRGPDGEGFYFADGVALAHRRLAIIDLNTGQQPMFSSDGRIAIVFNGEIYNYRELKKHLQERGHHFRTTSDTEVIINAWLEWGEECVTQLSGMFAIALWDSASQSLFIARDRLGEKPLYYTHLADGQFLFASELKSITVHPQVRRKISTEAVEDFFSLGYIPTPRTIYQDVFQLEPGFSLVLRRSQSPKMNRYWDVTPIERTPQSARPEVALDYLRDAVKAQMVADVPVGSFLSGGVDSSAVTALASSVSNDLNAFTIGFSEKGFDERQYAQTVAQRYNLKQHEQIAEISDLSTIQGLPAIFDEPFGDSSALPTFKLAQLASRTVKVALSGDGGDELFAGYRRYPFHMKEERIREILPAALRRPVFGALAAVYPRGAWLPRSIRARQTFHELSLNTAEGYFMNVSITDASTRDSILADRHKRERGSYRTSDLIAQHLSRAPTHDTLTAVQYVDLKTWLVSDILTKVDRTAMASGLEVRVPMLTHTFVEWALGLNASDKIGAGGGKSILKKALEPLLPAEILYRPKQGFSIPLADWFRGSLGVGFTKALGPADDVGEFINFRAVGKMLAEHQSGFSDHSRMLWLVWMFVGFIQDVHTRPAFEMAPTLN